MWIDFYNKDDVDFLGEITEQVSRTRVRKKYFSKKTEF